MKRRLIVNLLLAFIAVPFILTIRDYVDFDLLHIQYFYVGSMATFKGYVLATWRERFIFMPLLTFLFLLLPYNATLLLCGKKRKLNFVAKYFIFLGISILDSIIAIGSSFAAPHLNDIIRIFVCVFLSAALFVFILHQFVDRKKPIFRDLHMTGQIGTTKENAVS